MRPAPTLARPRCGRECPHPSPPPLRAGVPPPQPAPAAGGSVPTPARPRCGRECPWLAWGGRVYGSMVLASRRLALPALPGGTSALAHCGALLRCGAQMQRQGDDARARSDVYDTRRDMTSNSVSGVIDAGLPARNGTIRRAPQRRAQLWLSSLPCVHRRSTVNGNRYCS